MKSVAATSQPPALPPQTHGSKLVEEYGMNLYAGYGQVCAYWQSGRLVDPEAGASWLTQALQWPIWPRARSPMRRWFHGTLAELEERHCRLLDTAVTLIPTP